MTERPDFASEVETLPPLIQEAVTDMEGLLQKGGIINSEGKITYHYNDYDYEPEVIVEDERRARRFLLEKITT